MSNTLKNVAIRKQAS